jgi:hypothetical protein
MPYRFSTQTLIGTRHPYSPFTIQADVSLREQHRLDFRRRMIDLAIMRRTWPARVVSAVAGQEFTLSKGFQPQNLVCTRMVTNAERWESDWNLLFVPLVAASCGLQRLQASLRRICCRRLRRSGRRGFWVRAIVMCSSRNDCLLIDAHSTPHAVLTALSCRLTQSQYGRGLFASHRSFANSHHQGS